jgi:hypothetical protein
LILTVRQQRGSDSTMTSKLIHSVYLTSPTWNMIGLMGQDGIPPSRLTCIFRLPFKLHVLYMYTPYRYVSILSLFSLEYQWGTTKNLELSHSADVTTLIFNNHWEFSYIWCTRHTSDIYKYILETLWIIGHSIAQRYVRK